VRKASRQHRVSLTTVVQAYLTLENRGLVEGRPRSGFYVRYPARLNLSEPETSRPGQRDGASADSRTVVATVFDSLSMRDIIQLGAGVPSSELLPGHKLNRMIAAAARRAGVAAIEYAAPPGCMALRRALSRRALDWGLKVSPDEIITTNGCMEALTLSLRAVTNPGDTVAIESPTFFGIIQLLQQLNLKALEIPTHPGRGLDLDALDRVLRRRRINACLAIPNFNNPLGSLMPRAAKERLVAMLSQRQIPLIEDDLYGDLHFALERPHVAKSFDKHGLVLLCGSFSKSLAPGFRVGWLVPGRFFDKTKDLKCSSTGATATLPQLALADYLTTGGYDRHLRGLRAALKRQVQQVSHAVAESFPPETKMTRPSGGFAVWVELPSRIDSLKLHARALAEKISIAPGPLFSPRQSYRNFVRLTCGQPWSPKIERAIGVLSFLVRRKQ
jgi:DNA-binding transcriptional MocR family regulator